MEVILFPPSTISLQILCRHRSGINPLVRRSCTMNTSEGGALLVGSQRARATVKCWAVRDLRRSGAW